MVLRAVAAVALAVAMVAAGAPGAAGQGAGATGGAGVPRPDAPVLTARRLPGALVAPMAESRLVESLSQVLATGPPATCLIVGSGRDRIVEHRAHEALVPASAIKLVTAFAALRRAGGESDPAVAADVRRALADSGNDAATRLLAAAGGGDAAVAALAEAGLPAAGVVVTDGTGLDRGNRATCAAIQAILEAGRGGALDEGLAVAGETGTLRTRFVGTPVEGRLRAKTGSIRGVVALAGHAGTRTGGRLTFTLLANGIPDLAAGERLQERLATVLVAHPDLPDLDLIGPRGYRWR